MSYAALMTKPETSSARRSKSSSSGLRVGGANDSFETEADRVADTVSTGGRIPGMAFSRISIGRVQRQLMPVPSPESANRRESSMNLEDAFLQTDLGRNLARNLSSGSHPEAAEEHASSLRGSVIAGPAATRVVAKLAALKGVLPARVPDIALDRIHPGLKVHITFAGPPDRPTHGMVAFSYAPQTTGKPHAAPHSPAPAKKEHTAAAHPIPHLAHSATHHGAASEREDISVQRKVDNSAPFVADRSLVEPVLNSPGRPLDAGTRQYMESRIGYDFGNVRVHTDSHAADSARAMGAQAYTSGHNVVFGQGRFSPATTEGRRLIAHELTHVVQQDSAPGRAHPLIRRAPMQIQRAPEEEGGAADTGSGSWFTNPIDKLKSVVRKIPGFRLFTVILGKDPISDVNVERNATNVTHGVMELVPGGEDAFKHLQESGSLDRAFKWLSEQIDQLGFTIAYFKGLVNDALGSVKWGDITDPAGALARVAGFFRPPYEKLKRFALEALDKMLELVVEGVLSALGGTGVLEVLKKAGAAFKQIVKDPVGFLKNLLKSLGMGFNQFKERILEHLKNGLVQWLFGEIAATGITLPKKFDLAGIVNLILQVLGLTYAKIRKQVVDVIGEGAVAFLENTFEFLMNMVKHGPAAAWKMILEKASGLVDTMMTAIKDWVVTKIVTTAVVKLATMFNPVGAIIQAIQVIYNTVMFFMEKAKQIAALANAVLDSVSEIAAGNLTKAANYVEETMAKTIPVMLGFMAGLIGLGGIGGQIRKIIDGIQAKVGMAIKKIIEFLAAKAKQLYGNGKEVVANAIEWWKKKSPIKIGQESHEMFLQGEEDQSTVMVSSAPTTLEIFLENLEASDDDKARLKKMAASIQFRKKVLTEKDAQQRNSAEVTFQKLLGEIQKFDVKVKKPQSKIVHGPLGAGEGGTETEAYLSLNHPVGTAPNKSNDPPVWRDLGYLRRTDQKFYVRGHLLSQRLGGPGQWSNMMPITNTVNGEMLRKFEQPIIDDIATGKKLIYYKVHASYHTVNEAKAKEDPKEAEKRLQGLDLEYGVAKYEKETWVKPAKTIKGHYDPKVR